MRVIATIILVLALAWMLMNYMESRPEPPQRPVEAELTEPGNPEPVLPSSGRQFYSPIQKAKNIEQVLMEGAEKRREEIEAATQ